MPASQRKKKDVRIAHSFKVIWTRRKNFPGNGFVIPILPPRWTENPLKMEFILYNKKHPVGISWKGFYSDLKFAHSKYEELFNELYSRVQENWDWSIFLPPPKWCTLFEGMHYKVVPIIAWHRKKSQLKNKKKGDEE